MSGQHTPGPWRLRFYRESFEGIQGSPETGQKYGKMITNRGGIAKPASEEGKANAYLISAAPELLEALQNFVHGFELDQDFFGPEVEQARAAIAKATGAA